MKSLLKEASKHNNLIHISKKNIRILKWIAKYPVTHKGRRHLFQILQDILSRPACRVVDQGAAEGIICRLLQDRNYDVLAVDLEPEFRQCWNRLSVEGEIADCSYNNWWDGKKFDIIIAGAWVACHGSEKKITRDRRHTLERIRDSWTEILKDGGIVYFDVNVNKYPLNPLLKIFETKFEIKRFSKIPRHVFKCIKK